MWYFAALKLDGVDGHATEDCIDVGGQAEEREDSILAAQWCQQNCNVRIISTLFYMSKRKILKLLLSAFLDLYQSELHEKVDLFLVQSTVKFVKGLHDK